MKRQAWMRRGLSLFLALCVFAVFALSALFILTHADHKCTGAGCEICHEIKVCLAVVQHMSEAAGSGAVQTFGAPLLLLCLMITGAAQGGRLETLVALHIRLNN